MSAAAHSRRRASAVAPFPPAAQQEIEGTPAAAASGDEREDAEAYFRSFPLDPPLPDVRIPVKAPHAAATAYSRDVLMRRYPHAEVGDDMHVIFSEAGRARPSRLAPDVFVALKTPRQPTRGDYEVDRLGPPDFVLEVLSRSTWKHDTGRKLDCYQRMGVRECLLFDVTGEDLAGLDKALWGYALTPATRLPLEEQTLPNGAVGVRSDVLGLCAYVAERVPPAEPGQTWALAMRWHDSATGRAIPSEAERANAERLRANAEQLRASTAERRIVELERRNAELEAEISRRNGRR